MTCSTRASAYYENGILKLSSNSNLSLHVCSSATEEQRRPQVSRYPPSRALQRTWMPHGCLQLSAVHRYPDHRASDQLQDTERGHPDSCLQQHCSISEVSPSCVSCIEGEQWCKYHTAFYVMRDYYFVSDNLGFGICGLFFLPMLEMAQFNLTTGMFSWVLFIVYKILHRKYNNFWMLNS